jgi:glycosyltransferase involved in cell wall biosynthesis
MKIGILLEGSPKMGGGFFQSLKSTLILFDIKKYNSCFELIVTDTETKKYLPKLNSKIKLYKKNFITNYLIQFFEIDLIRDFLDKIKINHPFYKFIKRNKYDIIIFLGPSQMSKFCKEVAFISNIWDLDHKKNSQFPEHNSNNIYEQKEKLFNEITTRAFKILVPHESNKNDLINFYKADEANIITQNFIPMLPTIYDKNKHNKELYNNLFNNFKLPHNKIIIFYPAQFWAHKNHKYIIDAAEILKNKNNTKYLFIFFGGNKGNYKYLKDLIIKKKLGNIIKILTYLSDDEVIALYLNSNGVVMPTYCGPTNLPIYESFYFKKIIFYTKGLIPNDTINDRLISIDITSPEDFCRQLEIYSDTSKINKIVEDNYEYYKVVCNENTFKSNYEKILNEFSYLLNRWK